MKYIRILATALALLCLSCACNTQKQPQDYDKTQHQTGTQYESSWITGISKTAARQNKAVSEWIDTCAQSERDGIGHYVLKNTVDNGDGTKTHHLLLYRSATEKDAKDFTVTFGLDGEVLTVTPTYTSADTSNYGYDLIFLTLCADANMRISVELLVDGDYPGQIVTTTKEAITPNTFGTQDHE